jgi:hypothetical protein
VSDDETLRRLGAQARADQAIPPRWLALVEGRATPEEVRALEAEALSDPRAALWWARFRPLDPLEEARLVRALVVPQRSPKVLGAVVLLAGAAALVMALRGQAPSPLPLYALEASAPDSALRGAARTTSTTTSTVTVQAAGSALVLIVRPRSPVDQPVALDTFWSQGETTRRWDVPVEGSVRGAFRIEGTVSELLPGASGEVVLMIRARPADRPAISAAEAEHLWRAGAAELLVHRLQIRGE